MIVITQDIGDINFSSALDKLGLTTNKTYCDFTLKCGDKIIISERYAPDSQGAIEILELSQLVEPYLTTNLIESFSYSLNDGDTNKTKTFLVQLCRAEAFYQASDFNKNFFLSCIFGQKETAIGHKEFVHMVIYESTELTAKADYWDGSKLVNDTISVGTFTELNKVLSIDVSPNLFENSKLGKLVDYKIVAGLRSQLFVVGEAMDAAPALIFSNSFGCQETFYCLGTLTLAPELNRSTAYQKGLYRNFNVEENRIFKANTGSLSPAMMNLADDLLRSREIYIMEKYVVIGKEVTITTSKQERNNELDNLPSFTFEYRYAQRNHNILENPRAGRVFDYTYDNTFE